MEMTSTVSVLDLSAPMKTLVKIVRLGVMLQASQTLEKAFLHKLQIKHLFAQICWRSRTSREMVAHGFDTYLAGT